MLLAYAANMMSPDDADFIATHHVRFVSGPLRRVERVLDALEKALVERGLHEA